MIKIDKEKCNGCGACAAACPEGAIAMTGGKARLGAISFEVREAPAYDRAAVLAAKKKAEPDALPCGCPGTQGRAIRREQGDCCDCAGGREAESRLLQWPVQIRLVAGNAPYFDGANLLVAADCTAYAFGNFHEKFIQGRVTLIGCPKLDDVDYAEKLTAIFRENDIRSVTVVRMEVPCCGGMEKAVTSALQASGRQIPVQVVTISVNGKILS